MGARGTEEEGAGEAEGEGMWGAEEEGEGGVEEGAGGVEEGAGRAKEEGAGGAEGEEGVGGAVEQWGKNCNNNIETMKGMCSLINAPTKPEEEGPTFSLWQSQITTTWE